MDFQPSRLSGLHLVNKTTCFVHYMGNMYITCSNSIASYSTEITRVTKSTVIEIILSYQTLFFNIVATLAMYFH